jgi:hypothetical protein
MNAISAILGGLAATMVLSLVMCVILLHPAEKKGASPAPLPCKCQCVRR